MTLILDAGALLALEKNDKDVWERFTSAQLAGLPPVTHGGVVGQVWRGGGPRQARLAIALSGMYVRSLDSELGRRAGALLSRTGTSDVIDAALALLAEDGDEIMTSDPKDLTILVGRMPVDVDVFPV